MNRFLSRARAVARITAISLGFAGLWGSALAPAAGCSGNPAPETDACAPLGKCQLGHDASGGPVCGYKTNDGACKPVCDPKKCVAGNVCVKNECRLPCSSHADCQAGAQACTPTTDDGGKKLEVCLPTGHQPPIDKFGRPDIEGKGCPFGQMADCTGKTCPNGLECDPSACNNNPTDCKIDKDACKGLALCNIGKCGDGSACTVTTCATCGGYECVTKGEGDATAYCTRRDCASDAECGPGFACVSVHDPHDICGPKCMSQACVGGPNDKGFCNNDGDCQKGNTNFCGKTLDSKCVDLATAGPSYSEGSLCLQRKSCVRRDQCASCQTNVDCSLGDSDVCVTAGMGKVCAHFCKSDANCRKDQQCSPAGNVCAATPRISCTTAADCPTANDTCAAASACVPRSGGCHAETAQGSKFCYACTSDLDCGGTDSKFGCGSIGGGEKGCFDFGFATSCTSDKDCPKSPSGANGRCLDETDGVAPGNNVYHHCYFPRKPLSDGQNVGYSCYP